jgi:uncharacterized oxidoreductase
MDIKNNTILITGGTSGFGLEFTKRFLEIGNTVIITGRNQEKLDKTKRLYPDVHIIKSDVTSTNDIILLQERVTKEFPNLNILINNAGEMEIINLNDSKTELSKITHEIEVNLMAPIRMIQQFLPHLKKQNTALILNVTSGLALVPFPISPVYGASKSGLRSYTKSLRVQLQNTNVKVFEMVAPGASTPLSDKFKNLDGFDEKQNTTPEKVIAQALKGIENNTFEIYPGSAKVLKVLSRLAPNFIFKQLSKVGYNYYSN